LFQITDVMSNECPVSIAHNDPEAQMLVQQFLRARSLNELGVTSSPSSLPIPLSDALVLLSGEEKIARGAVAERDSLEDRFAHDSFKVVR
jgi:hypothetical protein